ncbi:MAG: cytochrome C oxidase assembly protein, partial [Muribaculaceae bacterium]|nr:cytochrome C oxidase assembly protein [Muribaculaceae bacterium]
FYPSTIDPDSSLTLRNASSSYFTLTVMSYVSLLIPIVLLYIAYVWHCMDRRKLSIDELRTAEHKY